MLRSGAGAICLLAVTACAGTSASGDPAPRSSSRVLAGEGLHHPSAANALDLIRIRWPALPGRSERAGEDAPIVYIDDSRAMYLDELRFLPTDILLEIRYLTAPEATFRYGLGHTGGAVVVRTRWNRDDVIPQEGRITR